MLTTVRRPYSTAEFLQWLRVCKEPSEAYTPSCSISCAYAQFLKFMGVPQPNVGSITWNDISDPERREFLIPRALQSPLLRNNTFGGLLGSLERALAETSTY